MSLIEYLITIALILWAIKLFSTKKNKPLLEEGIVNVADAEQPVINFDYVDNQGNETNRTIRVTDIEGDIGGNPTYIKGFCFMRKDRRTFKPYSMSNVIDKETGEIFRDGDDFARSLIDKYLLKKE